MGVENVVAQRSLWLDGRGRPGERLWMMTDALAQWCLAETEADENPLGRPGAAAFIARKRKPVRAWTEGRTKGGPVANDDVTFLAILL